MDFEGFFEVFRKRPRSIKRAIDSYCQWLLPPQRKPSHRSRQRREIYDQRLSIMTGEDMADGIYEDEMKKVCPPPVFMFLFSVIELTVFLSEVWYHYDK